MSEMDAFELRVADTLLWYADDVPTTVDAAAVAHRAVLEHPRTRARRLTLPWALRPVPALAWLVLLGLVLASLLAAALFVGSQPARRLPAVLPPLVQVFECPPGSNPDKPGPVDQARPVGSMNMAFDRRAGRLVGVVVGVTELVETWTFDVCTNTWSRMHPNREPPNPGWKPLVYDVDSDLTLGGAAYGPDGAPPGKVWAYDLVADTWTEKAILTDRTLRAYDPLSGLVLATKDDLEDTGQRELWTYDVETDSWTLIDRATAPAWHAGLAYDASVDRIVAYSPPETWLFDIRTGTWSRAGAETPVVEPNWAVPTITYDESAERTVVTGSAGMAAYDAAADRWETLFSFGPEYHGSAIVYDSVNERLVIFPDYWEAWTDGTRVGDVLAFDLASREWTVLLEPIEGQPAP